MYTQNSRSFTEINLSNHEQSKLSTELNKTILKLIHYPIILMTMPQEPYYSWILCPHRKIYTFRNWKERDRKKNMTCSVYHDTG